MAIVSSAPEAGKLAHVPQALFRGTLFGILVWITYALVENAFCLATNIAADSNAMFSPWYWPLIGKLALTYLVLGAGLGAVCGLIPATKADGASDLHRRIQSAAALSLIAAVLVYAGVIGPSTWTDREWQTCIAATVLGAGLALNLISKPWFERVGRYIHPWLVIFVLTAGPWINRTSLRSVVFVVAIVVSLVLGRLMGTRSNLAGVRTLAVGASLLLLLTAGTSFAFQHGLGSLPVRNTNAGGASNLPNIILVTMDTVRADHLSVYGYDRNTSPNLAAFSREATLYEHVVAASNMTLATHATLFTGLYPSSHGAYNDPLNPSGRPLSTGIQTLAGILAQHGYTTMSVVANHAYLNPFYRLDRGFEIYDVPEPVPVISPMVSSDLRLFLRNGLRKPIGLLTSTAEFDRGTRRGEEINEAAFTLLTEARQRKAPFFLFLNYMDAHGPYVPPAPFDRMFPGKLDNFDDASYRELELDLVRSGKEIPPREKAHLVSQYDGAIAYLDRQLGQLLSGLKERGIYDDTLIVVTSDHGENLGDRGFLGHWISLYHDEVGIPLIVKYPGQNMGGVVDDLVSQIDFAPTVLEVAGISVPSTFMGQSLRQPVDPDRFLYSEAFMPRAPYGLTRRYRRTQKAVYQHFQKFIQATTGQRELYDMRADPEEKRDIYNANPILSASLEQVLKQWAAHQPRHSSVGSTPDQVLKQLKSLGYVQ